MKAEQKQEACQLGKITSVNTQRRVTFHLPDGSQESCSDSGLGDPEPSSTASTTQPLPLSFPQEEYYEQTSPNSRTEGDGNSDPESSLLHHPPSVFLLSPPLSHDVPK
ncbi:Protocadherin-11 X-linked, partial [Dissostichus eleginoides]